MGRHQDSVWDASHLVHLGCGGTGSLARVGLGLAKTFKLSSLLLAGGRAIAE